MISVILPIYNVEAYLEKCLHSILTNTYRDLEIICVNDGSSDGCPQILRRIQAQDHRVVIVDQENLDLEAARNSGLNRATGDYVAFIDPDDWVHPRYFELLLDCLEKTGADMAICGVRQFTEDEEITPSPVPENRYRKLSSEQLFRSSYPRRMVWGRLMRSRDALALRFPLEIRAAQDTLYNLRLIGGLADPKIYELDAELYYYLQRPGSRIHTHSYEKRTVIADWYIEHLRDPLHYKTGSWSWILPAHSITTTLLCRYQAYLLNDQKVIHKCNLQLNPLVADLLRDRCVRLKYKLPLAIFAFFPQVYRWFRLWDDPTLKNYENQIRQLAHSSSIPVSPYLAQLQ